MGILLREDARVAVHGISGRYGKAQIGVMRNGGTNIVAGVAVGRGGASIDGIPVFDTMAEAVDATGANFGVIYLPPFGVRDAVIEDVEAGLPTILVATEFVPLHDTLLAAARARASDTWVIGPNSLGIITPGVALVGSVPPEFTKPGSVGVIGRSGTLTSMICRMLTEEGIGQSTCVHIGGDMVIGRNPSEYLEQFVADPATELIIYCGEIGGTKEYALAESVQLSEKPVVALIVGRHAPSEKRMGHAGALITGAAESAAEKREALRAAGVLIAKNPMHAIELTAQALRSSSVGHSI